MILVTHAIIGATVAFALRENPLIGFLAAFASHFAADAIPHWEYRIISLERNATDYLSSRFAIGKNFAYDILRAGTDCAFGVGIPTLIVSSQSPENIWIVLWGAAGGVLPDFLQLVYFLFPNSPLRFVQRFHHFIHAKQRMYDRPVLGISIQAMICALCLFGMGMLAS